MIAVARQFRLFDRPTQALMVNQYVTNVGFYMLMPYLSAYLAGPMGLATWAVGLILGIRNFSQQGMFLVGGALADIWGYKPLIIAGCALRTAAFVALGLAKSLPGLLITSFAIGFAAALFNPAGRAYLAADSGPRRVEAFAVFNVFYQAGILSGPLIGLALARFDFRITCFTAAAVFAVLTILQAVVLPADRTSTEHVPRPTRSEWRTVVSNRSVLMFSAAMIGCYVLSFQVYLALPLQAGLVASSKGVQTLLVTTIFAISGLVPLLWQVPLARWLASRLGAGRSLTYGIALLGTAFVPLAAIPDTSSVGTVAAVAALLAAATLLSIGNIVIFPFEMDTIVSLANARLVATYYGLYNTVAGTGILAGNLLTGSVFGWAQRHHAPQSVWVTLTFLGWSCALALAVLRRRGVLAPHHEAVERTVDPTEAR